MAVPPALLLGTLSLLAAAPAQAQTPAAPIHLKVHPGTASLILQWTKPSGLLTGYDVHYTSAPKTGTGSVTDTAAASGSNAATAWVEWTNPTPYFPVPIFPQLIGETISSLNNNTTYRVRVRSKNGNKHSAWVFGTGTPKVGVLLYAYGTDYGSTVSEGSSVTLEAVLGSPLPNAVTIPLTVTNHTAESTDHETPSSITIPAGVKRGRATITTNHDADSDDETFTVALDQANLPSLLSAKYIAPISQQITIEDDERPGYTAPPRDDEGDEGDEGDDSPQVLLFTTPIVQSEGGSPRWVLDEGSSVTVTAELTSALSSAVTIPLTVTNHTAESTDHETPSSITIPAGATRGTATITTNHDADSDVETFTVALDSANLPSSVGAASLFYESVWIIINDTDDGTPRYRSHPTDDDRPRVLLYGLSSSVDEGSSVTVEAVLSGPLSSAVTIPLTLTDDTAEPTDHGTLSSITIPAGANSGTGTITTTQDTDEDDEHFTVALDMANLPSSVSRNSSHPSVYITIRDDDRDDAPRLQTTTPSVILLFAASRYVDEGSSVTVEVVLGSRLPNAVTIPLTLTDHTAESTDHGTLSSITIPAGAVRKPGTITTTQDVDTDDETFTVALDMANLPSSVTAENVYPTSQQITIYDDDSPESDTPTTSSSDSASVSLLATPNPVGEGSPVTVRATLTAALLGDVTIPLSTRRDTSEEGDHGSLAAITVPAGFTSATGTLPTFEDDDGEDETFTLSLGSLPAGLTAGSASSVEVTITDSGLSAEGDTTTSSSGVSTTASGPDGETLLVGFGQIAQTPPEVSIEIDPDGSSPISEGEAARFRLTADPAPAAGESISVAVTVTDSGDFARSVKIDGRTIATIDEGRATFMVPMNSSGTADFSVATQDDDMDEPDGAITATVTAGTGYTVSDNTAEAEVTVRDNDAPVAAPPTEEKRAWHVRFGRSVSQQVVDALQQRFSTTTTPSGLQLTLAGETVTGDTPLQENHVLLSRLLGFESVSSQELAQGSSFSFSPEGAGAHLSFWGKGAFSSFNGVEESITLTGDVTTALVGAEWSNERWRAGAALSHSWGSGSYQGEGDGADGRISSTLTGIFPYGRYALTPRLGIWATAGYGWGNLSLNPDGDGSEYNPATTLALGAVGMDGLLLDGGSEGVTLTTTADALFLKTSSEAVEGLASSEGNITRLRLGLEASRAFPLANGAALSPSLEVGLRQDSGDAETGFGMDLGAGLSWNDPERGITATVKGRTLLSHGAEDFQDQGLALSFSWQPTPSNRGASLSLSHAVGLPAEGGLAALLNPTAIEVVDDSHSSGERFEARLAYGFPAANDRLTLTPSVATALSTSSRSYSLLWSLAPYDEHLVGEPWQLSLEGERQETSSSTVDHSLKLRFALPL